MLHSLPHRHGHGPGLVTIENNNSEEDLWAEVYLDQRIQITMDSNQLEESFWTFLFLNFQKVSDKASLRLFSFLLRYRVTTIQNLQR